MGPDDLLCSRNARPEEALVGRLQGKITDPPSLEKKKRAWRDRAETGVGYAIKDLALRGSHTERVMVGPNSVSLWLKGVLEPN
jgi:hypothetical protein